MYTQQNKHMLQTNYKTKKELREAIAAGKEIGYYQPNVRDHGKPTDRSARVVYLEGPWYPAPHRWYARVAVKNGLVVKILS